MKAALQPQFDHSQMTRGGVRTAPVTAAELAIPFNRALSRGGYQSADTAVAPTNVNASPIPNMKRHTPSPKADLAKAVRMAAIDHHAVAAAKTNLTPQRSKITPAGMYRSV